MLVGIVTSGKGGGNRGFRGADWYKKKTKSRKTPANDQRMIKYPEVWRNKKEETSVVQEKEGGNNKRDR